MSTECGLRVESDQSEQVYTTEHTAWRLTDHGSYLGVESPLLGDYPIHGRPEDLVITDVLRSPLGWRSADITQLSKLREHTTIPNTASFLRLGHVTDLIEMTDRICRVVGASEEERLAYKLFQLEDLSQGPLSHATDIAHRPNGDETFHAKRAPEALLYGGVIRALQAHKIATDQYGRLDKIAIPDWVECKAPDICTDRWQYGVEEARLWFSGKDVDERIQTLQELIQAAGSLDAISILKDGRMAFKDIELARVYAKSYLLLATEHWNDPVNRVQLHLLIETIKRSIINRRHAFMTEIDNGITRHPESYSYAIDHDILEAMHTGPGERDDFMYAARSLLSAVGKQERERFIEYKRRQFALFLLDEYASEYPSEILNGHLVDYGPPSSHVEIEVLGGDQAEESTQVTAELIGGEDEGIRYRLGPLKNRYVDPLVVTANGRSRKLSELDENFREILRQQQIVQSSSLVVRLVLAKVFEEELRTGIAQNAVGIEEKSKERPLSPDRQRREIESASRRAKAIAERNGYLVLKNGNS